MFVEQPWPHWVSCSSTLYKSILLKFNFINEEAWGCIVLKGHRCEQNVQIFFTIKFHMASETYLPLSTALIKKSRDSRPKKFWVLDQLKHCRLNLLIFFIMILQFLLVYEDISTLFKLKFLLLLILLQMLIHEAFNLNMAVKSSLAIWCEITFLDITGIFNRLINPFLLLFYFGHF